MRYERHLRLWEAAALCALCLCLLTGLWAEGRQAALASRLLRLHVVAASDAPYDQALKLRVRDAVLETLEPLLAGAESAPEARARTRDALSDVQSAAQAAAGEVPVRVSLEREDFPTRRYGRFALPAGRYETLRVVLGEGAGHNWWCVIFPPLCTPELGEEELHSTMSRDDLDLIREAEGYELRFRLLELWGELKERWR